MPSNRKLKSLGGIEVNYCTECGAKLEPELKYCIECGMNLPDSENKNLQEEVICPHCGDVLEGEEIQGVEKSLVCPQCKDSIDMTNKVVADDDKMSQTKGNTMQTNSDVTTKNFGSIGNYVTVLLIGLFLIFIGIFGAAGGDESAIVIVIMGTVSLIIAEIIFLVLLYRMWRFVINESHRYSLKPSIDTPGKAVGFLFIPIYNFYWVFQAYGKLPRDLNEIAKTKESSATMSESIGTILAVMNLLSIIPVIRYVAVIIALIFSPIFISRSIDMCKNLNIATKMPD